MSISAPCGAYGGFPVPIINWTPYDWTKTYEHSYVMNQWDWPSTISAGTVIPVCVESGGADAAGEASYSIQSTSDSMQFQFRENIGMQVQFTSLDTINIPSGTTLLFYEFMLSGAHGNYMSNFNSGQLPGSWMADSLSYLGGRSLREICVPGSHDSGMSSISDPSIGVTRYNTQTQLYPIRDQLRMGARWIDIRPCITGGVYKTCHGSQQKVGVSYEFFGAYGQTIAEVIDDINSFTASNPELIMVDLNGGLNSDTAGSGFTDNEWYGLFQQMLAVNNRYSAGRALLVNGQTLDQIPIGKMIGGGKPAVIFLVQGPRDLSTYASQGFYTASATLGTDDFTYYSQYADSDSPWTVAMDQVTKMKQVRTSTSSSDFLLSWQMTMTLEDSERAGPGDRTSGEYSLIEEAWLMQAPLYWYAASNFSQNVYPNVILQDAFGCYTGSAEFLRCQNSTDVVALCMMLNYQGLPYC